MNEAVGETGALRMGAAASRLYREGYRDYAEQEVYRARGWADLALGPSASLRVTAALFGWPRPVPARKRSDR